jgi:hypothetical protein
METIPDTPLWSMGEESIWVDGEQSQQRQRVEYVRQVERVAELWGRSGQGKDEQRAIVTTLQVRWKVTPSEARDLLRHAQLLQREGIREAARAGLLSKQHLLVLDKTIAEAPEAERDAVEADLLGYAEKFEGPAFRKLGQHILQVLDQDGKPPKDPELAEPKREFHHTNRKDGSMVFRGKLDPESPPPPPTPAPPRSVKAMRWRRSSTSRPVAMTCPTRVVSGRISP